MFEAAIKWFTLWASFQQCSQWAIITGTNCVFNALNRKILIMLHMEELSLFSVTWLCSDDTRIQNLMSTEFLNSLRSPSVLKHE